MDSSFQQHQNDPAVRSAIQNMRVLSSSRAAATSSQPVRRNAGSITRDQLREIMTFHAVTLEKELKPIREQVERVRASGQTPQVNPQVVQAIQQRISLAVETKYGVTDDQVTAAVDKYEAREDPAFKDILQRIATAFSKALG